MKMKTLKTHRSDRFEEIPFFNKSSQIFWRCDFWSSCQTWKLQLGIFISAAPRPKPLHRRGPEIAWMRPNGKMSKIEAASWRCALTKKWSQRKRLNSMTWASQALPSWIRNSTIFHPRKTMQLFRFLLLPFYVAHDAIEWRPGIKI